MNIVYACLITAVLSAVILYLILRPKIKEAYAKLERQEKMAEALEEAQRKRAQVDSNANRQLEFNWEVAQKEAENAKNAADELARWASARNRLRARANRDKGAGEVQGSKVP